jgi:predicted Fe-Mo cluster-binding NifX family protein
MKIAIPSEAPGGLTAEISPHFGHCPVFTLADAEGDQVAGVSVLPNTGHAQGGCMEAVTFLKRAGVDTMIVGGMGMRPLMGFQQVGIDVFFSEGKSSVGEALDLLLAGKARRFGPAQTCQGGEGACEPD